MAARVLRSKVSGTTVGCGRSDGRPAKKTQPAQTIVCRDNDDVVAVSEDAFG